jgi:hypothetical protein
MLKKIYFFVVLVVLASFAITTSNVYSYSGGRASCTLKPGSTYNGCSCHQNGSTTSITVTVTGPATLAPGATGVYTFSVTRTGMTRGGIDIAVSAGTLALATGSTGLKILSGELVQSTKFTGPTTKTFNLTAPNTPGPITIYFVGCGDSQNEPGWRHGTNLVVNVVSGINPTEEVVHSYSLSQNFPNPFNPTTTISFGIPKAGLVNISVYDITGKFVAELVNSELSAGKYNTAWDASYLASGLYFYKIQSGDFVEVKKMSLIK